MEVSENSESAANTPMRSNEHTRTVDHGHSEIQASLLGKQPQDNYPESEIGCVKEISEFCSLTAQGNSLNTDKDAPFMEEDYVVNTAHDVDIESNVEFGREKGGSFSLQEKENMMDFDKDVRCIEESINVTPAQNIDSVSECDDFCGGESKEADINSQEKASIDIDNDAMEETEIGSAPINEEDSKSRSGMGGVEPFWVLGNQEGDAVSVMEENNKVDVAVNNDGDIESIICYESKSTVDIPSCLNGTSMHTTQEISQFEEKNDANPAVDTDGHVESSIKSGSVYRGAVPYSDTDDSDSESSSSSSSGGNSDSEDSHCEDESRQLSEKELKIPSPVKIRGELIIDDLPPIEDLHISVPDKEAEEIGKVLHIVDTLVVVESYKNLPPLDVDSVLFLERGARPLGLIFDVIGPVKEPLYCVRFNSKEHIESRDVQEGMLVYCAPKTEHSHFVFVQKLLMMKGSDASWKSDQEVPCVLRDYSDDDEEVSGKKESGKKTIVHLDLTEEPKPKQSRHGENHVSYDSSNPQRWDESSRGSRHSSFQSRNPWNRSGQPVSNRPQNVPCRPQRNQLHEYRFQGSVNPPALNVGMQGTSHSSDWRNAQNCGPRGRPFQAHSQAPVFGRQCDPGSYGQLPPHSSNDYDCAWSSDERDRGARFAQPFHAQRSRPPPPPNSFGSGWGPMNGNPMPRNPENERYLAFSAEIGRLIQAYNEGAQSPSPLTPHAFGLGPPPSSPASSIRPPSFSGPHREDDYRGNSW